MAVNKNFVVKNGIEVNSNLILADANSNRVGIGSTGPRTTLDVRGGIAATDGNFSGILTAANCDVANYGVVNGTGSNISGFSTFGGVSADQLNVSGISTFTDVVLDEVIARNLTVTGISTIPVIVGLTSFTDSMTVAGISTILSLDTTDTNVSGVATIATLEVTGDSTFTGNIDANGGITANTAKIEDLTNNRVVIAGVGGELTDSNDLIFNAGTLAVTGNQTVSGNLDVDGKTDLDDLEVSGVTTFTNTTNNTIGYVDTGAVQLDGGLGVAGNTTVGGGLSVTNDSYFAGVSTFAYGSRSVNGSAAQNQSNFVQIAGSNTEGIQLNNAGTVTASLSWDGSAAFAGLVTSGGVDVTTDTYAFIGRRDSDSTATFAVNHDGYVNIGPVSGADSNIVLDGSSGSATFNNTVTGLQTSNNALNAFEAVDTNGTRFKVTGAGVLSIYDNTLTENVTISSDGSATFNGRIDAGSSTLDNAAIVASANHATKGAIQAYHYNNGSVWVAGGADGVTKSEIKADGSANLASHLITGSENSVTSTSAHGSYVGEGIVVNAIQPNATLAAQERVWLGKLANVTKSEIFKDGSATFAGNITGNLTGNVEGDVTGELIGSAVTTFAHGAHVTGILTATSFVGDGGNITGISTLNILDYGVGLSNGGGGGLASVVNDTTPQLGGDLDLNGHNIFGTGNIPSGNLSGALPAISGANLTNLNGSSITSGTVASARIGNLPASKITTGTFDAARIPNLAASKITSGTFDAARIPVLNQDTTGTAALAEGLTGSPDIVVNSITGDGSGLTGVASTDFINTGTAATFTSNVNISGGTILTNANITGITTATNIIEIRSDDSSAARLDFYCEVNNLHYTRLQSAAHANYTGNVTVTLPVSDGTILLENGSGANLTNLNAGSISSGTIDAARIPTLNQNTSGNAATATKLATARNIGGVSFDGTANINLPGVNIAGNQNTSGNASTATALANARTISGVSFDGTADITLNNSSITNGAGYITSSGNAATASALATARNIGGVSFDGTTDIDLPGVNQSGNQDTSGNALTASRLQSTVDIGGVITDLAPGTVITLPGVNSPGNQDTTGNASSADLSALTSKLQTARNIGGVSFDGSQDIDLPGVNIAGNQDTSGTAANSNNINVTSTSDSSTYPVLVGSNTDGNQAPLYDTQLSYSATANSMSLGRMVLTNTGTTNSSQLYFNGATSNRLAFNSSGVNSPTFTQEDGSGRSTGTKIALYSMFGSAVVDYAIGIESSAMWYSVATTSNSFKWYGGETSLMELTGTGLTVYGDIDTSVVTSSSDINLKKDIEVISNANDILEQISGVSFNWKETNKPSVGVIAQEVEKVLPELISENSSTGTKSVNYNGLIGVLIEAVKDLSQRVKELEADKS